jgi:hypothetical protein
MYYNVMTFETTPGDNQLNDNSFSPFHERNHRQLLTGYIKNKESG